MFKKNLLATIIASSIIISDYLLTNKILENKYTLTFYFVALFLLFKNLLRREEKIKASKIIFSLFCSFIYQLYLAEAFISSITNTAFLIRILSFSSHTFLFYELANLISNIGLKIISKQINIKLKQIHFFLFIFLVSIIYFIPLFPGIVLYDNGTMLQMAYGYKAINANNPIFHIGLMYLIKYMHFFLGENIAVAIYTVSQITIYSIVVSMLLIRIYNISKSFSILSSIFFASIPVLPMYTSALGKDLPFGIFLLLYNIYNYDIIASSKEINTKMAIKIFIAGLILCLTRNIGIYILIITSVPVFINILLKNHKKYYVYFSSILMCILISSLGQATIIKTAKIPKLEEVENKSLQLQQIARVISKKGIESLDEFEKNIFSKFLDLDQIPYKYTPALSDPIKFLYKSNDSKDEKANFRKAYFSLGKKYPLTYLKSIYCSSNAYFIPCLDPKAKPMYFFESNYISEIKNFTLKDFKTLKGYLEKIVNILSNTPVISLFCYCGIYQLIHIISFIFLIIKRKYSYCIIMFPAIVYTIGLLFSPVNGYIRYCLPNMINILLSVMLVIKTIKNEKNAKINIDINEYL